ncbi:protein-export membrane protein SecD, partial [Candidatus Curtissbacteria bacterium RBG_16_39_7]
PQIDFSKIGIPFKRDLEPKLGLDLQGGAHLVLLADMKDITPEDRDNALDAAEQVIERRVNLFGVTEPVIQTAKVGGDYRVIVELPGVTDVSQALNLIGKTAQLDFREPIEASPSATLAAFEQNFKKTDLTGKDLRRAQLSFSQETGEPQVSLEFNSDGAKKFEEITTKNVQKQVAIFLDDEIISAPTVQEKITGGNAVITGQFTTSEAKNLAIQLNAGALPIPIKVIEQRNVGPTLGAASIEKSFIAGGIGFLIIVLFMIANYGFNGFLADFALLIYTAIVFAIFKTLPVTLTLAGIAGFILSIGMAVDANILIFERIREEIRWGKEKEAAIDLGFNRAWSSIRDSNISSLITCAILFWMGIGIIRGFALTLAIGILVSMFSAVTVTRTFLKVIYKK